MSGIVLPTEPNDSYSNEDLRNVLGELNTILEKLKSEQTTGPFSNTTISVPQLKHYNARTLRQHKTDFSKVLCSSILSQGAEIKQKSLLCVGQGGIVLAFDIETGMNYEAFDVGDGSTLALASSPAGSLMAVGGLGCTVDVYPINEALQEDLGIKRVPHSFDYPIEEAQPDKSHTYLSGLGGIASSSPLDTLFENVTWAPRDPKEIKIQRELMRVDAEEALRKITFRPRVSRSTRYIPDGATCVTNLHASFLGHNGSVQVLEFLNEFKLISGSADSSILSWDVGTGQPSHLFRGHEGGVNDFCIVDNNTFVSGGSDGYILLWDNRTIRPQFSFDATKLESIVNVCTIAEGTCFAASISDGIDLFDIRSVRNIAHVAHSGADLTAMSSSQSGRVAVVGTADGTCNMFDTLKQEWCGEFRGHNSVITAAHILDDTVFTSSYDGTIKQWYHCSDG